MGVISEQNKPFNPDHANMDTSGFCYARAVYDPLMVVSANGKSVLPYLAESLTHNAAYDQWTITCRAGIKFHDSTPCNGDAIFANMQANYASSLTGPAVKALIKSFTHTPGSNKVTINTKYKWVSFPYTLAEQQICFIAATSTLGAGYSGLPIGTGPFIATTWNYNSAFICTANSQYWRTGLPYLAGVEFHPIPDGPTRLSALQSGTLDIIHEADGVDLQAFKSLGGGYTYEIDYPGNPVYSPSSNCIMMNCTSTPFKNATLRKACAYALNRESFVTFVDDGLSEPINGIYLKGSPYYKNPSYPAYNVTMAKKLVKTVPTAERTFTLTYVSGDPSVLEGATIVKNQLNSVGLTANLKGVSQGTLIGDAIFGAYQCMTWAQFGGVSPDLNYPWFSTKSGLNFAKNFDSKIESLMLKGMAATSASAREAAWGAVNNQIDKDLPYLWTDRTVLGVAAHSSVQNWKTSTAPGPGVKTGPGGAAVLQPNQAVLFFTETWKS